MTHNAWRSPPRFFRYIRVFRVTPSVIVASPRRNSALEELAPDFPKLGKESLRNGLLQVLGPEGATSA